MNNRYFIDERIGVILVIDGSRFKYLMKEVKEFAMRQIIRCF